MPKHFRRCDFCTNNTATNPDIVIFCANEHIISVLDVRSDTELFICEAHFNPNDVKAHGTSKRICEGSIPVYFPRKDAVDLEHNYVSTGPLNLVSMIKHSFQYHKQYYNR